MQKQITLVRVKMLTGINSPDKSRAHVAGDHELYNPSRSRIARPRCPTQVEIVLGTKTLSSLAPVAA
jgi:hypothetical protein